jgi:hypothetical protein
MLLQRNKIMRAPQTFSMNFLFLHIPKTDWWELEGPSEKSKCLLWSRLVSGEQGYLKRMLAIG